MPGSGVIVILGGGGTHPRTSYTFPMAIDAGDFVDNQSADGAAVDFQAKGSSVIQEVWVAAHSTYTFPANGDVWSVT